MKYLLTNYKTTALGAGALFGALGHLLTSLANGDPSTLFTDGMTIILAVSAIFSKDADTATNTGIAGPRQ